MRGPSVTTHSWGVIQHEGVPVYYEITTEGKVRAHEVGSEVEIRSPELLEAIEADIQYQGRKHDQKIP